MSAMKTCLWFASEAEEAAKFYCSIFPRSRVVRVLRFDAGGPGPAGSVMAVDFELDGTPFLALNGNADSKFNDSASLVVERRTQKELDRCWAKLTKGGEEVMCGWLRDRYGVAWQIVPRDVTKLLANKDPKKRQAAMKALLGMKKLNIAALRKAAGAS